MAVVGSQRRLLLSPTCTLGLELGQELGFVVLRLLQGRLMTFRLFLQLLFQAVALLDRLVALNLLST